MTILSVIITIVIVGVLLWAINTYVPMAASIKQILNIAVPLGLVIYLLMAFGVLGAVNVPITGVR